MQKVELRLLHAFSEFCRSDSGIFFEKLIKIVDVLNTYSLCDFPDWKGSRRKQCFGMGNAHLYQIFDRGTSGIFFYFS